jgi:hypothetical protein
MKKLIKVVFFILTTDFFANMQAMDQTESMLVTQFKKAQISKSPTQVASEIKAFIEHMLIQSFCSLPSNSEIKLHSLAFHVDMINNCGIALIFLDSRPMMLLAPEGNILIGENFLFNFNYGPEQAANMFGVLNVKFGLVEVGHFFNHDFDCNCKIFSLSRDIEGNLLPRVDIQKTKKGTQTGMF